MSPETTVDDGFPVTEYKDEPPESIPKKVKLPSKPKKEAASAPKPKGPVPKPKTGKPLPNLPPFKCAPAKFFDYWNSLGPEDVTRTIVYAYRLWPRIDKKKGKTKVVPGSTPSEASTLEQKKDKNPSTNIGTFSIPFKLEDVIRIFGTGEYNFRLNEVGYYNATVIMTIPEVSVSDWDNYPPVVDLDELDWLDIKNASYVERLRAKGIRPPGEEDKDMSAANAGTEILANTIKDLVNERQQRPQVTAIPIRDNAEQAAQKSANEMLVKTCETAIAIVKESATSNQHAANPLEMVEAVTKIAERISPKPDSSGAALVKEVLESNRAMNERISDMQNKQIDDLRTELRASRRDSEAAVVPPKTLAEQLDELEKFSTTIKKISGIGGDEESGSGRNGKTTVMDLMPVLIPAGLTFLGQIASMVHNYAVAKGATHAMAPPSLPLTPEQQQMAQNAGMLQGIEHQQQQPQQPQGPQPVINPLYAMFVRQHPMLEVLKKPLLDFFSDPTLQYPGAEFASFFIQLHGRLDYERLCGVGADMIGQLLASYPPIWNEIGGLPRQAEDSKFPIKVEQFITDFCNHDAIREAQDVAAEDEAVSEGPRKVRL